MITQNDNNDCLTRLLNINKMGCQNITKGFYVMNTIESSSQVSKSGIIKCNQSQKKKHNSLKHKLNEESIPCIGSFHQNVNLKKFSSISNEFYTLQIDVFEQNFMIVNKVLNNVSSICRNGVCEYSLVSKTTQKKYSMLVYAKDSVGKLINFLKDLSIRVQKINAEEARSSPFLFTYKYLFEDVYSIYIIIEIANSNSDSFSLINSLSNSTSFGNKSFRSHEPVLDFLVSYFKASSDSKDSCETPIECEWLVIIIVRKLVELISSLHKRDIFLGSFFCFENIYVEYNPLLVSEREFYHLTLKIKFFETDYPECEWTPDKKSSFSSDFFGSNCYFIPENYSKAKSLTAKTDFWMLGNLIFFLMTGDFVFENCVNSEEAYHLCFEEGQLLNNQVLNLYSQKLKKDELKSMQAPALTDEENSVYSIYHSIINLIKASIVFSDIKRHGLQDFEKEISKINNIDELSLPHKSMASKMGGFEALIRRKIFKLKNFFLLYHIVESYSSLKITIESLLGKLSIIKSKLIAASENGNVPLEDLLGASKQISGCLITFFESSSFFSSFKSQDYSSRMFGNLISDEQRVNSSINISQYIRFNLSNNLVELKYISHQNLMLKVKLVSSQEQVLLCDLFGCLEPLIDKENSEKVVVSKANMKPSKVKPKEKAFSITKNTSLKYQAKVFLKNAETIFTNKPSAGLQDLLSLIEKEESIIALYSNLNIK